MATPSKVRKTSKSKSSPSPLIPRKKSDISLSSYDQDASMDAEDTKDTDSSTTEKIPMFKNPNFVHSCIGSNSSKKTRNWKNLKQIVAAEKLLPWKPEDVTYSMIDAPPSFKPHHKYSDLSGLPAKYVDPQTKLRYSTAEEYSRIKMMPSDLVTGCLTLRKANIPV